VDKVAGPTCRSAEFLAGRVHLIGTSKTLVGGDPWVPMSLNESRLHMWDEPYLFRICTDGLLRHCVPSWEVNDIYKGVTRQNMDDIMEHSVPMQRFGSVVSFGP
jgi:hypothetical protein